MSEEARTQLQKLEARIVEIKAKHAPKPEPTGLNFRDEPLTHAFDEWNEYVRQRDIYWDRPSSNQRALAALVVIVFIILVEWLIPAR